MAVGFVCRDGACATLDGSVIHARTSVAQMTVLVPVIASRAYASAVLVLAAPIAL